MLPLPRYFSRKHTIDIEVCLRMMKLILRTQSYYRGIFSGVTTFIPPPDYTSDISDN